MFKKYWFIIIIVLLLVGGGIYIKNLDKDDSINNTEFQCEIEELTFYYLDECSWCQKVKKDGTISKLREIGIEIKEVDANVGPILHEVSGLPTFVINEKIYPGYKTFEELKELLGCSKIIKNVEVEFKGEQGEKISLVNGEVILSSETFTDNSVKHYNVELPDGKTIYFFVAKDKNGIYRAAVNACQVCFDSRMGFFQEGDFMVCATCGNKYPLERIATEKGGCNPGPINPNLEVNNGEIVIKQSELEEVAEFF